MKNSLKIRLIGSLISVSIMVSLCLYTGGSEVILARTIESSEGKGVIHLQSTLESTGHAIIIGIDDYPGTEDDLLKAEISASRMQSELLFDYNFLGENIFYLADSEATYSAIISAFNEINAKIKPEDVFFFYFAGHGLDLGGGAEYLCLHDSINPSRPSNRLGDVALNSWLTSFNCSQSYIFLETCHSGGFIPENQGEGRCIITSCDEGELSYADNILPYAPFSNYMFESLENSIDNNSDGFLSFEERFPHIYSSTKSYVASMGYIQDSQFSDGIIGESILTPGVRLLNVCLTDHVMNYSFQIFGTGKITQMTLTLRLGDFLGNEQITYSKNITSNGISQGSSSIDISDHSCTSCSIDVEITGGMVLFFNVSAELSHLSVGVQFLINFGIISFLAFTVIPCMMLAKKRIKEKKSKQIVK